MLALAYTVLDGLDEVFVDLLHRLLGQSHFLVVVVLVVNLHHAFDLLLQLHLHDGTASAVVVLLGHEGLIACQILEEANQHRQDATCFGQVERNLHPVFLGHGTVCFFDFWDLFQQPQYVAVHLLLVLDPFEFLLILALADNRKYLDVRQIRGVFLHSFIGALHEIPEGVLNCLSEGRELLLTHHLEPHEVDECADLTDRDILDALDEFDHYSLEQAGNKLY